MTKIFFSYSHKDQVLRDQLENHLELLRRSGRIEPWHDRCIRAGDDFSDVIDAELEAADIILLLISSDFLASDYCYEIEMRRALERNKAKEAKLIPVILRHCDWRESPFGKLKALPTDGKPVATYSDHDEAFLEIVEGIKAVLQSSSSSPKSKPSQGYAAPSKPSVSSPRSSNLRIKQTFTDKDKDDFLVQAFEDIASFFQESLNELDARHETVETAFGREARSFSCGVYNRGNLMAQCSISLGDTFGSDSINFSFGSSGSGINESISVDCDDQEMYLSSQFGAFYGNTREKLNAIEAGELLWSRFIEQLQ